MINHTKLYYICSMTMKIFSVTYAVTTSHPLSPIIPKKRWEKKKIKLVRRHEQNVLEIYIHSSTIELGCLCVGLTLPPPRLIFKAVKAFWISIVMALSTLPDDSFLWDFCRWSLSELLLSPALFPHIGQTFNIGFFCCHSMETFPCSFLSSSCKIFVKPSLGCARRWTRFRVFHASNKVNFLRHNQKRFMATNDTD